MVADLALNPDPLLLAKYRSESTISKGGTELSVNDNVVSCLLQEQQSINDNVNVVSGLLKERGKRKSY